MNETIIRKSQGMSGFNLAIMKFNGENWRRHLLLRDYLRSHPDEANAYSAVKISAVQKGIKTLIECHMSKDAFVENLCGKAEAAARTLRNKL